jgi:hypothetical protein
MCVHWSIGQAGRGATSLQSLSRPLPLASVTTIIDTRQATFLRQAVWMVAPSHLLSRRPLHPLAAMIYQKGIFQSFLQKIHVTSILYDFLYLVQEKKKNTDKKKIGKEKNLKKK